MEFKGNFKLYHLPFLLPYLMCLCLSQLNQQMEVYIPLYCPDVYSQSNLCYLLTLYFAMSKNGQTHFKNLAAFAARFLKYV